MYSPGICDVFTRRAGGGESRIADIDAMPIMLRRLTFTGSTLRPRSNEDEAAIGRELVEKVWPLFEKRQVKTVLDEVFPAAEVRAERVGMTVLAMKLE